MNKALSAISGKKTYMIGISLIVYLIVQMINGEPPNQEVVFGLLAGMGMTIRAGVTKSRRR